MLTQKRLKEVLHYDHATGIFTRRITPSRKAKVGDVAGSTDGRGYRNIAVDGKLYKAHRLALLYVYGELPSANTDHINGIRTDNRIENLRTVTHSENSRNQKMFSNNKSGRTGIFWREDKIRWMAHIYAEKKPITKHFDSLLDAVAWRMSKEREYGFHPNHGRVCV